MSTTNEVPDEQNAAELLALTLGSDELLELNREDALKYCKSCKQTLCIFQDFDIGKKTCRICLKKHKLYQRRRRRELLKERLRREFSNATEFSNTAGKNGVSSTNKETN